MKKTLLVILGIIVLVGIAFGMSYNGLVRKQVAVNTAWAQVQTNYQRRLDLIPNLVATVKGYAKHEKSTLVEVTKARAAASNLSAATPAQQAAVMKSQAGLTAALSKLMVVVERYPNLKANQNFLALQDQLEGTENRINVARQRYNTAVQTYDAKIRTFPTAIVANMMGFKAKPFYKADTQASKAPVVSF
jgi:LemA protein